MRQDQLVDARVVHLGDTPGGRKGLLEKRLRIHPFYRTGLDRTSVFFRAGHSKVPFADPQVEKPLIIKLPERAPMRVLVQHFVKRLVTVQINQHETLLKGKWRYCACRARPDRSG